MDTICKNFNKLYYVVRYVITFLGHSVGYADLRCLAVERRFSPARLYESIGHEVLFQRVDFTDL